MTPKRHRVKSWINTENSCSCWCMNKNVSVAGALQAQLAMKSIIKTGTTYSLFTLRKHRSLLRINGERGFLRVNEQTIQWIHPKARISDIKGRSQNHLHVENIFMISILTSCMTWHDWHHARCEISTENYLLFNQSLFLSKTQYTVKPVSNGVECTLNIDHSQKTL